MGDIARRLFEEAMTLPASERADLVERLRASLVAPDEEGVAEAWTAELTKRLAEIEAGRAKLLTVSEAMSIIRGSGVRTR